jgi:superfamily II DNA or RNA helicase
MIQIDYDAKRRKGVISGEYFDIIREYFSVDNPASRFLKHRRFIPRRIYAITPTGQFDIGLVGELQKFLIERDICTELHITPAAQSVLYPSIKTDHVEPLAIPLRDYQTTAIRKCVAAGRGVVLLGTGAGKTLTCATLIENYYKDHDPDTFKCLVIVPDLGLVNQTYNDFIEYKVSFKLTRWTGSITPDLTSSVIIANTAILQSKFDANEWLRHVDVVIVDETHKAGKGTGLSKILDQINTPHKFGFTGTLPEDKMNRWAVLGKIGPVLIERSSHDLRAANYLVNVTVKMMQLHYKTQPPKILVKEHATQAYQQELEFIYGNAFRNRVIQTMCANFCNNILVLVNHIEHGEAMTSCLNSLTNKQVFFIRGEVEVEDRDRVKHIMENNNNVVCVAISSIFSTGVNIKNIHMIIFAAGGKSFIRTVQSIGRGLRLHPTKDGLTIIDIADALDYGIKHATRRQEIYRAEQINYTTHKIIEK